jgi:hypothetical protein
MVVAKSAEKGALKPRQKDAISRVDFYLDFDTFNAHHKKAGFIGRVDF